MFSSIVWPSWDSILHGEVTFEQLGDIVKGMWKVFVEADGFSSLWDKIISFLTPFGVIVPAVLLVLSLVQAFFGRKLLGFQKFVGFFALGYLAGASMLHGLLVDVGIGIPDWIIGIVAGIVLALLSQFLYIVLYIVISGYAMYMMTMGGQVLPEGITVMTVDNMVLSLVIVAVVVLLMLIFRKWVEMIGTSVLGGYLTAISLEGVLLSLTGSEPGEAIRIVVLVAVAILGFFVQIKTRRRKIKF